MHESLDATDSAEGASASVRPGTGAGAGAVPVAAAAEPPNAGRGGGSAVLNLLTMAAKSNLRPRVCVGSCRPTSYLVFDNLQISRERTQELMSPSPRPELLLFLLP